MPTLKASQRYRLTQRISASYVLAYLRHGCDSKIYCLFIVITIGIQPLGSIQLQGNKTLDCVCRFLVTSCDGDRIRFSMEYCSLLWGLIRNIFLRNHRQVEETDCSYCMMQTLLPSLSNFSYAGALLH